MTGHTRVVSLSGASINGDAKGVTLTLPVPTERRRSSTDAVTDILAVTGATKSGQHPATLYLRVPACAAAYARSTVPEVAAAWTAALTGAANKKELGEYSGVNVATRSVFKKLREVA